MRKDGDDAMKLNRRSDELTKAWTARLRILGSLLFEQLNKAKRTSTSKTLEDLHCDNLFITVSLSSFLLFIISIKIGQPPALANADADALFNNVSFRISINYNNICYFINY